MSYNFYSILHLGSLFAISLILGGLWGLYTNPSPDRKLRSLLLSSQGVILFFIFLAGFGLIAKTKLPFPWPFWIYGKLTMWLLLGVMPFFIKKASQRLRDSKLYFLVLIFPFALLFSALLFVRFQ